MTEPAAMLRDADALAREARAWVVRLTSGAATDADAWQLHLWRDRSPAHDAAFREAVRLWNHAGLAAASLETPAPRAMGRRPVLLAASGAAAAAALVVAGSRAGWVPSLAELTADHRTRTGEQRRLVLEDGSTIEMNTQTSLSVSYTPGARHVALIAGEAAFSVTRDPARPFTVAAAGGKTTVLGTVFTIRHEEDAVRVACLSGRVSVARDGAVELGAGERVRYGAAGLGTVGPAPDAEASWRGGMLVFRNTPLAAVVAEINRYRPGHVLLLGRGQAASQVSGVFHISRPDEMLAHVARVSGLAATPLPGGIVILR